MGFRWPPLPPAHRLDSGNFGDSSGKIGENSGKIRKERDNSGKLQYVHPFSSLDEYFLKFKSVIKSFLPVLFVGVSPGLILRYYWYKTYDSDDTLISMEFSGKNTFRNTDTSC